MGFELKRTYGFEISKFKGIPIQILTNGFSAEESDPLPYYTGLNNYFTDSFSGEIQILNEISQEIIINGIEKVIISPLDDLSIRLTGIIKSITPSAIMDYCGVRLNPETFNEIKRGRVRTRNIELKLEHYEEIVYEQKVEVIPLLIRPIKPDIEDAAFNFSKKIKDILS